MIYWDVRSYVERKPKLYRTNKQIDSVYAYVDLQTRTSPDLHSRYELGCIARNKETPNG